MKHRLKDADIVLMPYAYIIDPHKRESFIENNFPNSIIIFDEAHNLSKVAEDASSFDVRENDILEVVFQVSKLKKKLVKTIDTKKQKDDENEPNWRSSVAMIDSV
jgi:Rad3-related DNA helicase